jgi:hypothetical protein
MAEEPPSPVRTPDFRRSTLGVTNVPRPSQPTRGYQAEETAVANPPAAPPTGTSQGFGIFGSGQSFPPFPRATTDQTPFPNVTTDQAPHSTSLPPVRTATEV